ncbi:CaiB/BaiF CoA-transferase family protein [Acidovorax sp. FJL06]|uniref:CaiB/BaiF CoA transferase family protein n=1 Tax=Acidovorax sp. FJL06 TaxID=2153365 RepID=UPI000F570CD5|nr:CoA transferase [Acidovorax sp. FJL06]RQO80600.1 CoA transferase [Acidovorax sp. FJL06]
MSAHAAWNSPRPLAGCRVLDLSLLLPGPYCTWLLACFGAEVIKVEPPTGDPVRRMNPALFAMLNRGKQSVVLDLKQAQGREALLAMVAEADILVEGFRPGALERLGLSVQTLMEVQPRLVVGSISGFGWTGPYRDHPGHDIGFLSLAGYFAVPSQLDHQLVRPQIRLADMVAGQSAALALAMARAQVQQTGKGCHVDASIYDATMGWTAPMMLGSPADKAPAELAHVMADSALYRTADGRHLCIATLEDKFWTNFAQAVSDLAPALGDARWHTRQGRDQHKQALAEALAQAIATQPLSVWMDRLQGVDTAVEPVYTGREALEDPHAQARGFFTQRTADDGQPELFFPAMFDGHKHPPLGPAPALGQGPAERFTKPLS